MRPGLYITVKMVAHVFVFAQITGDAFEREKSKFIARVLVVHSLTNSQVRELVITVLFINIAVVYLNFVDALLHGLMPHMNLPRNHDPIA